MKRLYTLLCISLVIITNSAAQTLENTSWRFRPQLITLLETLGSLSADSITMNFNSNHDFEVLVYDQGNFGVFMKGYWEESGSSGLFVDTMQVNAVTCNTTDTCKFVFNILDTVLTLSQVVDQCPLRGSLMSGEYYGQNTISNSGMNELYPGNFIQLFPNPAQGYTTLPQQFETVKIISQEGKVLAEFYNIKVIPLDFLPKGIYYLATENEGKWGYGKLVVH